MVVKAAVNADMPRKRGWGWAGMDHRGGVCKIAACDKECQLQIGLDLGY